MRNLLFFLLLGCFFQAKAIVVSRPSTAMGRLQRPTTAVIDLRRAKDDKSSDRNRQDLNTLIGKNFEKKEAQIIKQQAADFQESKRRKDRDTKTLSSVSRLIEGFNTDVSAKKNKPQSVNNKNQESLSIEKNLNLPFEAQKTINSLEKKISQEDTQAQKVKGLLDNYNSPETNNLSLEKKKQMLDELEKENLILSNLSNQKDSLKDKRDNINKLKKNLEDAQKQIDLNRGVARITDLQQNRDKARQELREALYELNTDEQFEKIDNSSKITELVVRRPSAIKFDDEEDLVIPTQKSNASASDDEEFQY